MRIYNGKKSSIDLPLTFGQYIHIDPKSVSKDFMANNKFLAEIVTAFEPSEIALIVGGVYELNMCAAMPALTPLIVQSLDEAIERFNKKVEEKKEEEVKEEIPTSEDVVEEEEVKEENPEQPQPETPQQQKNNKKKGK